MEAQEPKPDWRLRLGAFVLFCITAFFPALPFLLVIAGTYLCVVDGAISGLETITGTELPSPRDFFRQNTTGEHRNGHIGGTSTYCDLCWDRSTDPPSRR